MCNKSAVINLNKQDYIGQGSHRLCYQHPEESGLCVKVAKNAVTWRNRRNDQNHREASYYRLLERRGVSWHHIAKCYGWTETNKGKGLLFELIADKNNQPLPNLEEQLNTGELCKESVAYELRKLNEWIIKSAVVVDDLRPSNIIYDPERDKGERLIVIDGVSNRNFIKLASYIPALARNKMKRKWRRFCQKYMQHHDIPLESCIPT